MSRRLKQTLTFMAIIAGIELALYAAYSLYGLVTA